MIESEPTFDGVRGGEPVIDGLRVSVRQVATLHRRGETILETAEALVIAEVNAHVPRATTRSTQGRGFRTLSRRHLASSPPHAGQAVQAGSDGSQPGKSEGGWFRNGRGCDHPGISSAHRRIAGEPYRRAAGDISEVNATAGFSIVRQGARRGERFHCEIVLADAKQGAPW